MSLDDAVERATFTFRGTTQRSEASTLAIIPPTAQTVVVRIDEVLLAAAGFGVRAGDEVTVQLLQQGSLEPGQTATFFTVSWIYGDGVAVREVAPHRVEPAAEVVPDAVAAAAQRVADRELASRATQAELVVVGRVAEVRPAEAPLSAVATPAVGPVSEHDPDWHEAVIQVQSAEKGEPPGERVTVHFPASMDVMWHRAPKFHPHQRGVFLLHRTSIRELEIEAYTVPEAADVRPLEELGTMRALMREPDESP
jgi:hypothetical protein